MPYHVQDVLFGLSRSRQASATGDIGERQGEEGFRESLDLLLVQRGQNLLHQAQVVVAVERFGVFGNDGSDGIGRPIVNVDVGELVIMLRQWLHEATDDLRRVFGDRDLLAAEDQRDEDVLLVRLEHDVRHGHCGRGNCDFEVVQSAVVVLHGCVDHPAVVVIEQKVLCRRVLVVLRRSDCGGVDVEEAKSRIEELRAQAELAQVGVQWRELRLHQLDLLDGHRKHLDALSCVQSSLHQEIRVQMEQIKV